MFKYDWFLRDFRKRTAHLDFIHRNAYRELLDVYYDREQPIPSEPALYHRLVGAHTDEEKSAVNFILCEYFIVGQDGMFHNHRADEEIAKYKDYIKKQSARGQKSANVRWGSPVTDATTPVTPRLQPDGNQSSPPSSPSSSSSSVPPSVPLKAVPPPPPQGGASGGGEGSARRARKEPEMSADFIECYSQYPKHEERRDAWKAWEVARRSGRLPGKEKILHAIAEQKKGRKWREGFIKSFGSWIRKDCWCDEVIYDSPRPSAGDETMRSAEVVRQRLQERGEL